MIQPKLGRLHVKIQHGRRAGSPPSKSAREVLLLSLTARGPINSTEGSGMSLDEGLGKGREAIVGAFACIMSEEAQVHWGRK